MTPHDIDEASLDVQLRGLPIRELDARRDAAVLRSARAVFLEQPRRGPLNLWAMLWGRAIAPTLVTATVACYLVWAVQAAGALYH